MTLAPPPPPLAAILRVRAGQASRAGRKADNEDAIGIRLADAGLLARRGIVLALADGVSGSGAGRQAAETCVQGFLCDYYATPDTWSVRTAGERVLASLNRWLHGQGQHYSQMHRGFLATFSALVLRGQTAHFFHVGDSRIWRLRGSTLEALTRDHATRVGGGATCLTRALGMEHGVEIDYGQADARVNDVFLLTTDGVHDVLPPARLRALLADAAADPQAACENVLDAAHAAGSDDNLSCQVLIVDTLAASDADDSRQQAARLPLLPDLEPGHRVDRLCVEAELHANARSQVYLVRDEETGQRLVLKTPSRLLEEDSEALERFALEDWLGQRIDHPHLVRGLAPRGERHGLYLLQEYLAGETLAAWARRHPQPPVQTVVAFAAQAIKGLQALHRRDVLHQDLRPDNLFLCADGRLKLIDLGAARIAGVASSAVDDCQGAAEYAAPECLLRLPRDERADQFALAVTLYELLTGAHPYGEDYARAETLFQLQRLCYRSACRSNPHVPLWLDAALGKALSLSPAARYDSLSEFLADLRRPNPGLAPVSSRPWLERDPAGFWRAWALVMTLLALLQFFWLLGPAAP